MPDQRVIDEDQTGWPNDPFVAVAYDIATGVEAPGQRGDCGGNPTATVSDSNGDDKNAAAPLATGPNATTGLVGVTRR